METINKGLTVTEWMLRVRPKILPQNLCAQFVFPSPKVWGFNEKKASLGVRSPWIKRFDKKEQTKLPLERINNFWFAWLGRHFGVQFLSGLSSRGHHLRVQTFHLKKNSRKMIQKADFWRLVCFFIIQWSYFSEGFTFGLGNVVTFKRYLKVARLFFQELHSTAYIYFFSRYVLMVLNYLPHEWIQKIK